ncbi:hypothetical protein CEXT_175891 [Caerostris extrusa]|uniref:Uncharacterized protein n=1 Tax=Caerostris extrusa TaxID=172846 RepID=A0AAV4NLJ4_CAEEX|nr:hypothetical protein CEXT_175891 [Caerostris extrusa]
MQDFASTIDSNGLLTIKPNEQLVNVGLRTAGGTTTEVNLQMKTLVHFEDIRNAVVDRGGITPTLIEVVPSETDSIYNNYLEPDDAEVQDQQTYPQTVPIEPSFASETVSNLNRVSSSNREATPEIPDNNRIVRTQAQRGPLRITTTVVQRPGSLRSGVFAQRPGVRVRVRPVTTRIPASEAKTESDVANPVSSVLLASFESSRGTSEEPLPTTTTESEEEEEDNDFSGEDDEDETETETPEDDETTTEVTNQGNVPAGRKRLKITIRRSPGVSASRSNTRIIRPSRTRPRFYVVTRTASPDGGPPRPPKRPVSVKVSRRPRPSAEPQYETYTKMTSVPVVFGLSTTYRNALVTSSSLVTKNDIEPSKTIVLTYFTTTTYTVPYTVDGVEKFTTLEETNSELLQKLLVNPDADLSFVSTTTVDYSDVVSPSYNPVSPVADTRPPAQTLRAQLVNNQLNVGPRVNLVTKVSNGVSLIVASEGDADSMLKLSQPTLTLKPTMVTDALLMMNKGITTLYEPRTFYTTFTFFTTFFSEGTPSIATSEQVITNVYSVPVTQTVAPNEPITVTETSENLVSTTFYTTHTFFATLFNGSETIVTPLEELQSSVISSTETYTITKTIIPTPSATLTTEVKTTEAPKSGTTTIVNNNNNIEEIETDIVTLTIDNNQGTPPASQPPLHLNPPPQDLYTTRTIQATNTHYITLFSGSESILSSITEVAPSVITELVKQLQEPTTTTFIAPSSTVFTESSTLFTQLKSSTPSSPPSVEPTFQDLVPSIRTQYTTLTYFTNLIYGF